MLWGPFPHEGGVFGGGIGGYARCNSQMLRSRLSRAVTLRRLPMTVPRFHGRILAALHLVPRLLADCLALLVTLLRDRPDVLHITALYWRSIYREAYAVALCRLLGVQVIYDLRAGTFIDYAESRGPFGTALLRLIMSLSTEVTVEGKKYVEYVERKFGRTPTWIPNFVLDADLSSFPPAELRQPGPDEPFRIAFTGYLIPDKGVDVLLRAAHHLSRRFPVELTLIGEQSDRIGEELERFRTLQSNSFRLVTPGRLELPEVLSTLREQHVFVFLSRFHGEGHSNAVSEAMAMGLPVVASRHGFLADVVTDECGVVLSDPRDAVAVTEVLWELRSDWDRLRRLGRSARERIRTEFGEGPVLGKTEALYQRCARRAA
ncbi:MAG TPA: glycosyltransferase family 4 protein [Trueperaceae bacterium]